MRYASIRSMDISNGAGLGIALFVQGCHFHCVNCFNQETWDFNGGKKWTDEVENKFINLLQSNPYIDRVSILGGEPLCDENVETINHLVKLIKIKYPSKMIWCYTGYTWEQIFNVVTLDDFSVTYKKELRQDTIKSINILVDGLYIDNLKDLNLHFRGSTNQRIIDVQKSFDSNSIVLWENES